MADKVESLVSLGIDAAELEAQARMPPAILVDMRKIYGGDPPQSAIQTAMMKMMDDKFPEFVKQLHKSEMEWREVVAKLNAPGRMKGGGPQEPVLEGKLEEEAAYLACEEWLKNRAESLSKKAKLVEAPAAKKDSDLELAD